MQGVVSKCKQCDEIFKHDAAGISFHVQKEHNDITHHCDKCKYETKVLKNLKYHKLIKKAVTRVTVW